MDYSLREKIVSRAVGISVASLTVGSLLFMAANNYIEAWWIKFLVGIPVCSTVICMADWWMGRLLQDTELN